MTTKTVSSDAVPTSEDSAVKAAKLTSLSVDERNVNRGTERGHFMLESILRTRGAGRGILVDRNGKIIAGNHVAEVAVDVGLDDCIIVPTDGRKLVVVQRTDVDLDSPAGRELAIADNRASEVGLNWDRERLAELVAENVDLSAHWSHTELADLLGANAPIPKFEAEAPPHRLDQLAAHCATCTCRKADQP